MENQTTTTTLTDDEIIANIECSTQDFHARIENGAIMGDAIAWLIDDLNKISCGAALYSKNKDGEWELK